VSFRHITALGLLFLNAVVSLFFFGLYVAIVLVVGTYVMMERAGFLFPRRDHPYYISEVRGDFSTRLAVADRFGDENRATELRARLDELARAYPNRPEELSVGSSTRQIDST
jgi:hypothetical protein